MKRIYLTRHAKSSWNDPALRDFDRPLNDRGIRDGKFMPKKFLELQPKPEMLVSSSAKRAILTANYFNQEFGLSPKHFIKEANLYHATEDRIFDVIYALPNEVNSVMLFGHNPGFTLFANLFSDHFIDNVPTCGIVTLESDAVSWTDFDKTNTQLAAFYFPKQFQ